MVDHLMSANDYFPIKIMKGQKKKITGLKQWLDTEGFLERG